MWSLFTAVAAQRAEGVAGHAFGVNAHQHIVAAIDFSHHQGEVFFPIAFVRVVIEKECAIGGGNPRLSIAHQLRRRT